MPFCGILLSSAYDITQHVGLLIFVYEIWCKYFLMDFTFSNGQWTRNISLMALEIKDWEPFRRLESSNEQKYSAQTVWHKTISGQIN